MPTYQTPKSRTSKSVKKTGFKLKWWMGLVLVGVVAAIGIVILNFSHASGITTLSCATQNPINSLCTRASDNNNISSNGSFHTNTALANLGYTSQYLSDGYFTENISNIFGNDNGKVETANIRLCWKVVTLVKGSTGATLSTAASSQDSKNEIAVGNTIYSSGTIPNVCGVVSVKESTSTNSGKSVTYGIKINNPNEVYAVNVTREILSITDLATGQPTSGGTQPTNNKPSQTAQPASPQPQPSQVGQIVVGKYAPGAPKPGEQYKGTMHAYLAPANSAPGNTQVCIKNKYGQVVACGPGGNINLLVFNNLTLNDQGYTAYIPHENMPAGWTVKTAFVQVPGQSAQEVPVIDYAVSNINLPANSYAEVSFYFERQ